MVLKNRVAVVTGGSSGIGRGVALEFSREGAAVVVADVREAPKQGKYHEQEVRTTTLEEVRRLGGEGEFVKTDMGDAAGLSEIAEPPELVGEAIVSALKEGRFHAFPDSMAQQIGEAYQTFAENVVEADLSEG